MILEKEVSTTKLQAAKIVIGLSYEKVVLDAGLLKYFTGHTP